MIEAIDLWRLTHSDAPGFASLGTMARCEMWKNRIFLNVDGYVMTRVEHCRCCGDTMPLDGGNAESLAIWPGDEGRCARHYDRNPCAVEGCKRTTSADGKARRSDQYLCGEHWRRYVPPHSRERRLYHKHFRRAKRLGWDDARIRSFHRFWDGLVARVRERATEGFIDIAAIEREFGAME